MYGKVVIAVALALLTAVPLTARDKNCSIPNKIDVIDVLTMCKESACSQWCTNLTSTVCTQLPGTTETPTSPTETPTSPTETPTSPTETPTSPTETHTDTVRQDGVSLGLAIGLLFVGMAFGFVVTCLLCVCVPTLNRKATSVLSTRTFMKPKKDVMVPSAPQTSFKLEYESTLSIHDHRDSHIYTGIQTEIPLTDGKQITSPVYNVISEGGVHASFTRGPNADYQALNDSRTDDTYRQLNGPGNSVTNSNGLKALEGGADEATNHNYFTLNAEKVCSEKTSAMADTTDNTAYFVLEKDPSGNEETKCESQHDYFILQNE